MVGTANVSAIVVSYRTGAVLERTLAQLLAQPEVAEVIVVDNGNDVAERALLDRLDAGPERLRVLRPEHNLGFAAGCNLAAEQAVGAYVALINPDLMVPDGTFAAMQGVFAQFPHAWLCGARLSNMDGSEQRGGRREVATPWRALAEVLRLARLFPRHPHFRRMHMHETPTPDGVVEISTVSGAFMMLPRARWRQLGGMDAAMFLHMEDADICLRILKAGGTVLYCGHVPVYHYLSTSDVPKLFVEWHKVRSGARFFLKHFRTEYPGWALGVVIVALWARFLLLVAKEGAADLHWIICRWLRGRGRQPPTT